MNAQKISTFLRKTGALASVLAASAAVTGSLAPSASAATITTLLPLQLGEETEIDVGFGCLTDKCLTDLTSFGIASIESLVDTSSGTKSRLFIDNLATASSYGSVEFEQEDAGTNPPGLWFRPSETNANGTAGEENGQLEIGTFKITFTSLLSELKIRYFDTETSDSTGVPIFGGVLATDGTLSEGVNPLPAGPDGNIQYQTFKDVNYITLKLGKDFPSGTGNGLGDGVDFQLETTKTVPEPATLAGLGLVAGAMAVSRRRKATKTF